MDFNIYYMYHLDMMYFLISLGIIFIIFVIGAILFNTLQNARVQVDSAWSDIDVQLRRRYDLIPKLVSVVKEYVSREKDILETVTRLRTDAMSIDAPSLKSQKEEMLESSVHSILVQVEAYPEIKSNNNFLELQNQLVQVEEQIQHARRYYNGTVRIYNTKVHVIPYSIVAFLFGFKDREFFTASHEAQTDVKVTL